MDEILVYFALRYQGDFYKILNALKCHEEVDVLEKAHLFQSLHAHYITIIDDDYPDAFKHIDLPPFVLFYYGRKELLNHACISMSGSVSYNGYGYRVTDHMVRELTKRGYTIVSGMNYGIESVAHLAAIRAGSTIGVLAGGIDYIPKGNEALYELMKKRQLLISEYPGIREPSKETFHERCRIVTGLSEKLLITQCDQCSGAMAYVSSALEQGRDVGALPGRISDPSGTNELIDQGAKLVTKADDLLNDI